jgi:hypothetical protein
MIIIIGKKQRNNNTTIISRLKGYFWRIFLAWYINTVNRRLCSKSFQNCRNVFRRILKKLDHLKKNCHGASAILHPYTWISGSRTTRPIETRPTDNSPHQTRPTVISPHRQLAPWTTRPMNNSPQGQLALWTTRPMNNSPQGQLAPWTTRPMDNSPHLSIVHPLLDLD